MSERMTGINLPGIDGGWAEWGRKTVPEMIAAYRRHAEYLRAEVDAVLAASDEDFHVETYLGPHARSDRKVLQEGKRSSNDA